MGSLYIGDGTERGGPPPMTDIGDWSPPSAYAYAEEKDASDKLIWYAEASQNSNVDVGWSYFDLEVSTFVDFSYLYQLYKPFAYSFFEMVFEIYTSTLILIDVIVAPSKFRDGFARLSLEATDKSYYESFTDVGEFYRTLSPGSYKLRADAISDGGYEGFADVEAVFKTVPEPNILFLFGSLVLGLVGFSFRKN